MLLFCYRSNKLHFLLDYLCNKHTWDILRTLDKPINQLPSAYLLLNVPQKFNMSYKFIMYYQPIKNTVYCFIIRPLKIKKKRALIRAIILSPS